MSGPIRHIVMWRLRGETPAERSAARAKVKTLFEGLRGRIEGLTHIEVGLDVSDVDYACDVVLFSEFTDHAALAAYATHPEHLRVREALGDLRIGRFQVDYPIKETGA
ncbi:MULTISPECIES: Dabb family protein [Bradyrhizobium]|uniref:Dabb family protein n=1 Tax=Bradyrhizobium TaxID=374 RepID=UPI001B8A6098|nr:MULTISPECIES: Dabb family protein [Bradyrhizobium]MBR0971212.1 Dabb family protein [Bradyrhizobium japonicum]